MRPLLIGAMILPIAAVALYAQTRPNFSGVWVREPGGFELLQDVRRIARGAGVDGLAAARDYTVEIEQTDGSITLHFPHGTPLTRPAVRLSPGPHVIVQDRGAFWTRFVSDAEWQGPTLVVTTRSSAGWWKSSHPDTAKPREIFTSIFSLTLSPVDDRLTLVTSVSDDKGDATYRQVFRRK